MNEVGQQPSWRSKKAILKAVILVVFIIVAIYLVRFTPVKDFLTKEALGRLLEAAQENIWGQVLQYNISYSLILNVIMQDLNSILN